MKQNSIFIVTILCVNVLLYAKTIGFDYSFFDDDFIILKNRTYFEDKDIQKVFTADPFLGDQTRYYRPLQSLSFMCDVAISGGLHTWMFHLTNVILFGIIGCILFIMLLKFNFSNKIAFIGSLIFCVHPLFVTAVAWIPARGDLLLTLFSLLSMICFIKFLEKEEVKYLLGVWLTFTLAIFCKETAAFLPLLFLIYFFTVVPNRKITWNHIILAVIMGLSGCFWLFLRNLATYSIEQVTLMNFFIRFLTIPIGFSQLIMIPIDLSPLPSFTTPKVIVGIIVISLLFFIVYKKNKRAGRDLLFYLLWFLILIIPNFMRIESDIIDYMDYRFLLPMIGILMFTLSIFPISIKGDEKQGLFVGKEHIWIAVVIVLWFVSFLKANVYRSPESYYGTVIRFSPVTRPFAHYNRGCWKFENGDLLGALDDYNNALIYNYTLAYHNRGVVKSQLGDLQGALDDFTQAITNNNRDTYLNRAILKVQMEDLSGALIDYTQAIFFSPKKAFLYVLRASLKTQMEDLEGALHDLDSAILIDRFFADAYGDRGSIKGMMGNFNEALDDINIAIHIDSMNVKAYHNRAVLYWGIGDYEDALKDCEKVLQLDSGNRFVIPLREMILNQNETQ